MKKESKKKLIKSTLVTSVVALTISPLAIAAGQQIIKDYKNLLNNNSLSRATEASWTDIPNINVATNDMFINTENIKSLSSVARGQMSTPYGWLGTYEKNTAMHPGGSVPSNTENNKDYYDQGTLVHIGWDGSILWANNDSHIPIYSAKYHFKSNTIFVVRTRDQTGAGTSGNKTYLTIHDASTGKVLFSNTNSDSNPSVSGWNFNTLFNSSNMFWNDYNKQDLYYQDMVTLPNGDILWIYFPNILKMIQSNRQNNAFTISTYFQSITNGTTYPYAKILLIKKTEIDNAKNGSEFGSSGVSQVQLNINPSTTINEAPINPIFYPTASGFGVYYLGAHYSASGWYIRQNIEWSYDSTKNGSAAFSAAGKTYGSKNQNLFSAYNNGTSGYKLATGRASDKYNQNTLLIPTRNMFDENIVTISYAYASQLYSNVNDLSNSSKVPIFNVIQLDFLNNFMGEGSRLKQFKIGQQIYAKYLSSLWNTLIPTSSELIWYPWPGAVNVQNSTTNNYFSQYTNQLYNRLISVSPYDNTFIYVSRPNFTSSRDRVGDVYNGNNETSNWYASFWIGNSSNGQISNLFIPNFSSAGYAGMYDIISKNLISDINNIYKNGFWFDINSLTNNNVANLYFNVTGNDKNKLLQTNTQVKSSPIGMIRPSFNLSSWYNVTSGDFLSPSSLSISGKTQTPIKDTNYANYITSRADLTKWYPRTYQSLTQGANSYSNNFQLNNSNLITKLVADNFDKTLTKLSSLTNNNSVELFSNWNTGGLYNNVLVKSPRIVTNIDDTKQATPSLNALIKYEVTNLNNSNTSNFINSNDLFQATTLSIPITIPNLSWQFLSSWSNDVKLDNYSTPIGTNILGNISVNWIENIDQGKFGQEFGSINNMGYWSKNDNNLVFEPTIINNQLNNQLPLRVLYAINPDPNKSLQNDINGGQWLNKFKNESDGKFTKKYPLVANNGETNFNQILKEYVDWKAQNLTYSIIENDPSLGSLGLGQITIDAYLELNPYWNKLNNNNTIYTLDQNNKCFVDVTTGLKYIYKDEYAQSRSIYKQNSTTFGDNNKYGFGSSVNDELSNSWDSIPNSSNNLTLQIDSSKINNDLVRTNGIKSDQIFVVKYTENHEDIVISPNSQYFNWAKSRFSSYNQMVGLTLQFEYQTESSPSIWNLFNENNLVIYDDDVFGTQDNIVPFTIPKSSNLPTDITKIRFKLIPLTNENVESNKQNNITTKYNNWDSNNINSTFISDDIPLEIIKISVDYNWFNNVNLAFVGKETVTYNKFLNDENGQEQFVEALKEYEKNVKNKSNLPENEKQVIRIKYSLEEGSQNYLDEIGIYEQLKNKWTNYNSDNGGIIALYSNDKNGVTNATRIYVKFVIEKPDGNANNYQIEEKNQINNNYVQKTNINFKIQLKDYFDVLQANKTNVVLEDNGSIKDFIPPSMTGSSGSGFLFGKTFNEIVQILKKFGVTFQYRQWETNNNTIGNWGQWYDDKKQITKYNPSLPIIQIRLKDDSTYRIEVSTSGQGTIINYSSFISLTLNIPLTIKWNDYILDNFKTDFVSGNTKDININAEKEQKLITSIAQYNKGSATNSLWDDLSNYLEIKYAIGESNNITKYYSRQEFINYLSTSTTTQYNNQINIKLFLKDETNNENGESKFILDNNASKNHVLYQKDNTNIKIYIVGIYDELFDKITISGTTGNLNFVYPGKLQEIKNGNIEGLKIAFSLKQNINYNEAVVETDGDINNQWVTVEPNSVPTNIPTLKIKVYITNTSKYLFDSKNEVVGSIDLTKIAKLIDVNSNWFNTTSLSVNTSGNYLKDLNISDIKSWEDKIWNQSNAIKMDTSLRDKVSIKYTIENDSAQYDAENLIKKLKGMQEDYSSSTLGIVYLWDGTRGIKINATFETNDDLIIFSDINGNTNNNLTSVIQTNQIKTYIDLSNYVSILTTNKTSVQLKDGEIGTIQNFIPPMMTGEGFLGGKTFDQISKVLNELGIEFKFNNGLSNETWNVKNDVNSYNQSNPILYLGVEYNNQAKPNIVFNFGNNNSIIENTTLNKGDNALAILQLQAPVSITVNLEELKKLAFQGDTKNITNVDSIKNQIVTIINSIKDSNSSAITNGDLNLEIRFSLNEIKLEENISDLNSTDDGIWYTFEELNSILINSTTNYTSNKILARFYIKDNPELEGGINKYQLSSDVPQVINAENLDSKSEFNIYINDTEQTKAYWIKENLKLSGSQDNFNINGYNNWKSSLPQGLTVQFNISPDSNFESNDESQPDNTKWLDDLDDAKPISTTRDFWIRFKVGDAYVFQGASSSNSTYSDPIKLDASAILVSLKIKSEWLNKIMLTGNLRYLNIDENQVIEEIRNNNQMPIKNIIQIEYTYDGINWLEKDEFEAKLQELKGAKNDTNWIILREDIKTRFVLNKIINEELPNKYTLEIDGKNINETNQNEFAMQLITNSINQNIKGYINLDKFNEFNANNFKVTGTNSNANLITSNINDINAKLNPYSSINNLFSILYKWDEKLAYSPNNKIWTPGKELIETMHLNGTYENRFFGIQFKVDNVNYELYRDNKKQNDNSYEISTVTNPAIQMQISVEIENPFTSTNSKIEIKFLDSNSQPQWYNNDGAFTFSIEKYQTSKENQIFNSLSEFLSSLLNSSYTQQMKDALELVYYVSATELNEEEYKEATSVNEINKYDKSSDKYNIWKTLNDSNDISQLNYHLKVGDYVIIALRIKENSLTTDANPNGYVLKDNDHSPTQAIRVSGYKVHTDYIDVDWNSMRLRNIGLAESASYGLDGYAMLDQISLKQSNNSVDNSNDYLNVSLRLNYFTEFYVDSSEQVLVSGSGSRLVKRDPNGATESGYYKDSEGQEIKDSNDKLIPILYKPGETGILADPIKTTNLTRSHNLIESTSNVYTLELSNNEQNALYSFFKNQFISITFENKKGLAEGDQYDYYVDNKDVSKDYTITHEIKFPIENDNLIQYTFNSDEFIEYIKDPNNLNNVYENANDLSKNPINGQAKLIHMYKVTKTSSDGETKTLTTTGEIQNEIQEDFNGLVKLKTTYTPINGTPQDVTNNDLSSITTLSNGDRFRIEIVSSNEEDLIYAQQPSPLIFTISGLYEQDIDESLLQYLRVQQNGEFNGEGSFGIYVDDPNNDNDDNQSLTSLLQGYKFMIRVWNGNKTIKQAWTTDIDSVNNLVNGDKVEWKLVAPSGSPVEQAYYNTVADQQNHDANNNKYAFIQVNKTGNFNTNITANGIGTNPTADTYPENSGLLIESLKEKDEQNSYTSITETEFIRLMNGMNFSYTGINGQGNMISDKNVSDVVVNTTSPTRQEFTFEYLIQQGYLKFYSNNIEFNWNQIKDNNGNWLISPGTLSNGDQISIRYQDDTMASYYQWSAPEVSGLKNKSDSMSLLTYVGIGVASLVTLGAFALIYFRSRNRKLKK